LGVIEALDGTGGRSVSISSIRGRRTPRLVVGSWVGRWLGVVWRRAGEGGRRELGGPRDDDVLLAVQLRGWRRARAEARLLLAVGNVQRRASVRGGRRLPLGRPRRSAERAARNALESG